MHVDLLGGEPFHPAREAEATIRTGQRAQPVSQQRPGAALLRETIVVVRFAIMNIDTDAFTLLDCVVEIPRHLPAAVVLKQFGIGPLHPALSEQRLGGSPRPAESFEKKNRFRKFFTNPRDNVLPDREGNLVAGIATEAVHAAPAPDQKRVGEKLRQRRVLRFQFDEILPDRSPSARTFKVAVRFAEEPFRMILLQGRSPAGVVDHHVEKHPGAHSMRGLGEFAELIHAGRSLIEFHEGRIDRRQILAGIRTAIASKACVGGGSRIDRQQMNNPTAEGVDDVRQLADDIAEFAGWRNHRVTLGVEDFQLRLFRLIDGFLRRSGFAEQTRESAVDGIARAIAVRMHREANIRTVGPDLKPLRIDDVTLRAEIAHLG